VINGDNHHSNKSFSIADTILSTRDVKGYVVCEFRVLGKSRNSDFYILKRALSSPLVLSESYRIEVKTRLKIGLSHDDAEIGPIPTSGGGHKPEKKGGRCKLSK
jgi:hypothetical protein